MLHRYHEGHAIQHVGWPRATVLGANDGILSTASLIGVGSASAGPRVVLLGAAAMLLTIMLGRAFGTGI